MEVLFDGMNQAVRGRSMCDGLSGFAKCRGVRGWAVPGTIIGWRGTQVTKKHGQFWSLNVYLKLKEVICVCVNESFQHSGDCMMEDVPAMFHFT